MYVPPAMTLDGARIFHVNVNCADLERSRRFYADGLGLDAAARTTPERAQDGSAFGLAGDVLWDAWILTGEHGFDGGAIDLLEWKQPPPTGRPPRALNERGFQRVAVQVPDLDAAVAGVRAHGGTVLGPPFEHANADGSAIRLAVVRDPDGTAIQCVEGGGPRLSFVAVTCADLARSVAFYRALGFNEVARFPSERDDGAHLGIDGRVATEEVVLAAPGGGEVLLMLVGFDRPTVADEGARPANALGMWRVALVVDDLDAALRTVVTPDVTPLSRPATLEMGNGLPALRFVCFPGPDREIVELIERPT
jgi:catechol 2,3-dioxygenase-like lactoylglutathione lyase family enzyme